MVANLRFGMGAIAIIEDATGKYISATENKEQERE